MSYGRDKVVFGFICGSVARGTAGKDSDIDILIAVNNPSTRLSDRLKEAYIQLHRLFGFNPDILYPGEFMSLKQLDDAFALVSRHDPTPVISNSMVYDGIVWAGMVSGPIEGFVGDETEFFARRQVAAEICRDWYRKLQTDTRLNMQPPDMSLKEIISYKREPLR